MFLLLFAGLFIYKLLSYYQQNKLYSHYVFHNLIEQYRSKITDGYTDKTSYRQDELQKVFLNPRKKGHQTIKLYSVTGELIDSVNANLSYQRRGPNPSENGFGYQLSFTYKVPNLKSGMYLWEKVVPFIVRKKAPITVVYPTNTINAYDIMGGKSLYRIFTKQTHLISFHRPTFPAVSFHTSAMMSWLNKQNQYNINYITDQDLENNAVLEGCKLLIIIGHSEYWTRKARTNFDSFVNKGGDALILSGNTMWWQVRYTNDLTKLICYKNPSDPINNPELKTINWVNEELNYPVIASIGADFQNGGFGRKSEKNMGGFKILAPNSPLFKNTHLKKGDILHISTKEYDGTILKNDNEHLSLDLNKLGFYKGELLGFDYAAGDYGTGNGAFLIFQKNKTSGIIINAGTTDWCSNNGIGGSDSTKIQIITKNMIEGLLSGENLFDK
ncbi:MAG TPA: N,N-dimethylformamidase beta subunit family domain-containing protein [Cytophagales bacterium]|nr:N,N-dimethylformamidase beta subunit family domain-containing protein [Cytophagales bacterium]